MGMTPAMLTRWQQRRQQTLVLQAVASDRAGLIIAISKFVRIALQTAMLGFRRLSRHPQRDHRRSDDRLVDHDG